MLNHAKIYVLKVFLFMFVQKYFCFISSKIFLWSKCLIKNCCDFVLKIFDKKNRIKYKICFFITKNNLLYVNFKSIFSENSFWTIYRIFFNIDIIFIIVFYKNINKYLKTYSNGKKIKFLKYKKHITQF